MRVLTDVAADVEPGRERELLDGFLRLVDGPLPSGLVRTELLCGTSGRWHVHTLWESREALDAMRAAAEPPAAPALFRSVGAEPALTVLNVAVEGGPATS